MDIQLSHRGASPRAPLIVLVDSREHPHDLAALTRDLRSSVASVQVDDWNASLAPWEVPGLYREEGPFGDGASATIGRISGELVPGLVASSGLEPSRYAIAGYSLAGLFALYSLLGCRLFCAAASVSGSLWYDGWTEYLRRAELDAPCERFAYLSVGTKEKRASQARLKTVEERTLLTDELLRAKGVSTQLYLGPGGHLQHVDDRLARALAALDAYVTKGRNPDVAG